MISWLGGMLLLGIVAASEAETGTCYRSVAEAAAQSGVGLASGYRLEGLRRDPQGFGRWASVRSCSHPEWPAWVVAAGGGANRDGAESAGGPLASRGPALEEPATMLVKAGAKVRVIRADEHVRFEVAGVAQTSAALGARVSVRVGGSEERFVTGIVRGVDVVEMD